MTCDGLEFGCDGAMAIVGALCLICGFMAGVLFAYWRDKID